MENIKSDWKTLLIVKGLKFWRFVCSIDVHGDQFFPHEENITKNFWTKKVGFCFDDTVCYS